VLFGALPLPATIKVLVVPAVAVPACFAVGYSATRIPWARRML
jgi:hypothetical protein